MARTSAVRERHGAPTEGNAVALRRGARARVPRRRGALAPVLAGPLPYVPPRVAGYNHPVVQILEIVDDFPPEVALARRARYHQALADPRMEGTLVRALESVPSVAGLAMMALAQPPLPVPRPYWYWM